MGSKKDIQFVDFEVTKIKFDKEIQEFKNLEGKYRKRGVICTKIEDFSINLIFAIPHFKPQPIAFAVNIDYTNWDSEPPSIKVIDSFTEEVLNKKDIMIEFLQWNSEKKSPQPIFIGDKSPFFCIQGVREYHQHPYHSGDSWMLHRTEGEGKLSDLIEKLMKHSISIAGGYFININGFGINFPILRIGPDQTKIQK